MPKHGFKDRKDSHKNAHGKREDTTKASDGCPFARSAESRFSNRDRNPSFHEDSMKRTAKPWVTLGERSETVTYKFL